jgi:hypothetical protein
MNKTLILNWIFLLLIGCCACNNLTKKRSSVILPMDSVVAIVADCYFLEGEIYIKQWKFNVKDYAHIKYDSLFETRKITKDIFVENVKYYFTNEKYTEIIMNKLDEVIEQRVAFLRDSLDFKP